MAIFIPSLYLLGFGFLLSKVCIDLKPYFEDEMRDFLCTAVSRVPGIWKDIVNVVVLVECNDDKDVKQWFST